MPTPTYTPLGNITLSGNAATVTFSSISQIYRDVIAVASVKGADGEKIRVSINVPGGYLYNGVVSENQNGSPYASYSDSDGYVLVGRNFSGIRSDTFTSLILNFNDYSVTDKNKPILYRAGNAISGIFAGSYRVVSNNAITSIIFQLEGGNFTAGSSFAIYGVVA
jgi:hypothetical protein